MRLKYRHRKITMTITQIICPNRIALCAGKKGCVLLKLELWSQCLKNPLQSSNTKQKLLKRKNTIQIATFNVRTLNGIGQQGELTASVVEHNIDLVCLQEHRYHHNEVEIR